MSNQSDKQNSESIKYEIFDRIEAEHIEPTARLLCILRNSAFWVLWGVTVLFGSIAFAILIFTELNSGWEFYEMTHTNALTFFIDSLPLIWILLLALLVVFGIYNFRKTRKGYRHSVLLIVFLSLGSSVVGGLLLHTYGISEGLERGVARKVPLHQSTPHIREVFWMQPEHGMYAGTVETFDPERGRVTIRTYEGNKEIFTTQFLPHEILDGIKKSTRVQILATSSKKYEAIVACHIAHIEEHGMRTLAELGKRKKAVLKELADTRNTLNAAPTLPNPCRNLESMEHFGR